MRRTTALMSNYLGETKSGEYLGFELCKGGYFSDRDEYGLKVVGKTEQKTLSGKNLCPVIPNTIRNGITYTQNADGSITVNGTSTSISWSNKVTITLPAGTYTFLPTVSYINMYIYSLNDQKYVSNSFTLTKTTELEIYLQVDRADITVDNVTFYPQLELGSVCTEYEPYCGGIPSPNPDFMQEIQCVKSGTKIISCGKNHLNWKTEGTWDILINGGVTTGGGNYAGVNVVVDENGILTFTSAPFEKQGEYVFTSHYGNMLDYLEDGKHYIASTMCIVSYNDGRPDRYVREITIDKSIMTDFHPYVQFTYDTFAANNFKYSVYPSIVEGNTSMTANSFEPYIYNEIEVPCDLYSGDIWYPISGKIEKHNARILCDGNELWYIVRLDNGAEFFQNERLVGHTNDGALVTNKYLCNNDALTYKLYSSCSFHNSCFKVYDCRFSIDDDGLTQFKAWLAEQSNNGTPLEIVYELSTPVIEQYEPQPIFAPIGSVKVFQQPTNLHANLSATVLKLKI